jgi:hypothetical protein
MTGARAERVLLIFALSGVACSASRLGGATGFDAGGPGDSAAATVPTDGPAATVDSGGVARLTHAIAFTGAGAHVFAAEWLVFQPSLNGSVDSTSEVAAAPASWATQPRVVEAQSLSLCGSNLNQAESIRNLEAAGFPLPQAVGNIRSLAVTETITPDRLPVTFCVGLHHPGGAWTFHPDPILPTGEILSGQATGGTALVEDQADLIAILFETDALVGGIQYQTSP